MREVLAELPEGLVRSPDEFSPGQVLQKDTRCCPGQAVGAG